MTDDRLVMNIACKLARAHGIIDPEEIVYHGEPTRIPGGYYVLRGQPMPAYMAFMNEARLALSCVNWALQEGDDDD